MKAKVLAESYDILSIPLQLMKATVLAESYDILSIFIVICLLQGVVALFPSC
jgi:hypothetical protein